jgi:myosin-crossreactive antigen
MVKSERVFEDLTDYRDFAIIFNKWNANIDMKNEFRCFIFDNECECIVNTYTFKKLNEDTAEYKSIKNYIENNKEKFPEKHVALDVAINKTSGEIIFIEFNCVDNELDTFDMDAYFSDRAKELLKKDPAQL